MSALKAYPKIFAIGHTSIPHLFDGEVEITEKIDGSQFAFGKINGELIMRSKGRVIPAEPPENDMFRRAWDMVKVREPLLQDNTVYYGEYLQKPKHNTLAYTNIPLGHIALFGIAFVDKNINYEFYSSHKFLAIEAERLKFGVVPLLYSGHVQSDEQLLDLLDNTSSLGGAQIEGIVVKNYNRDTLVGGQYLPITVGKFVSEAFKEKHRENWSKEQTVGGKFEVLKSQYRTEARWEKAIQHGKEDGLLVNEPKDIGTLIKSVQLDIEIECKEEIKEELWKLHSGDILRNAIRGLPEFYKRLLVEQQFDNEINTKTPEKDS